LALRAVLFDLDGTLWGDAPGWKGDEADFARLTELEARRLAPVFSEAGVRLDPLAVCSEFWSFARRREEEEAASLGAPNGPGLLAEFLASKGTRLERAWLLAAWAALDVPAREYGRALFPDTAATLERLGQRGLAMAVVSNRLNGAGALSADFEELGIRQRFQTIVCSSQVGRRKPHAAVFERALKDVGVSATEAVMVGDSFENDVRGARALGMTAVLKLNGREPTAEESHEADHLIQDLSELLELPFLR
jgi:HAD superfamily hydrolase (TIGR01509 family)